MENKENNSAVVKVQLNSLDALNRFIGDNPEMKIQVKEAIIQQFTKQYLKESIDEIKTCVRAAVQQEVESSLYGELFEKQNNYHYPYKLTDKFKEIIYQEIQEFMRDEVKVMIQEAFGPILTYAAERANISLENIESIISERNIDALVKRRLNKIIEKLD